jgi:RNA recognition motif-containing protein
MGFAESSVSDSLVLTLHSCKLVIDKVSGKSLEYAFVDFENPASALQAQQRVNGLPLGTKRLKVPTLF